MWKSGLFSEMSRYVYERFCRICNWFVYPDLYIMLNNFYARLDIFKLN